MTSSSSDSSSVSHKLTNKDVVAIVSGGLDSAVMLWHLRDVGYTVKEALTFNYGQRHSKEISHAKAIVQAFGNVPHHIVDLHEIGNLIDKGALTGNDEIPHQFYTHESQRQTIVPNRNMIMISIAAGRAITINARYVAYAAHKSDTSVYPDCRPEFIKALDQALYLGNEWTPVSLLAPFQHMTKADIVRRGLELKVPLEKTWSCYEGGDRPCLQCGTCLERTEAFLANHVQDPALTLEEWENAIKYYRSFQESTNS